MTRKSKALLAVAAASVALVPVAAHADIVIDPANLAQAVLQVAQDVQLVEQFRQQLQNQQSMLKGWGYTRLPDLLNDMGAWQKVFAAAGKTYTAADPGPALDRQYPTAPTTYAGDSDTAMASCRRGVGRRGAERAGREPDRAGRRGRRAQADGRSDG